MVAFEQQRIARRQTRFDVGRADAEVGQERKPAPSVRAHELHRLARVVRYRDGMELEGTDDECLIAVDAVDVRQLRAAIVCALERAEREPHRHVEAGGQRGHAADMIAMLVRDDDRIQALGRHPEAREPGDAVAKPEAAIDQHPRHPGLDQETVAFTPAAETREAHLKSALRDDKARAAGQPRRQRDPRSSQLVSQLEQERFRTVRPAARPRVILNADNRLATRGVHEDPVLLGCIA